MTFTRDTLRLENVKNLKGSSGVKRLRKTGLLEQLPFWQGFPYTRASDGCNIYLTN